MAIDRRRFLALLAIGVPAMVVGKRLGILAWLKSYFSALRGVSLTAESIPKTSSTFIRFLKDTVERFQRETGISARFVSELDEVKMPQRAIEDDGRGFLIPWSSGNGSV